MVVALVGAATAIFAASIGLVQNDIKRVLAYSTVSQLGYMFAACGVGAFAAAIFHLMTHAFFKALLFLGSGSVIHGMSGEQDMRKMGGLRDKMPVTAWTMYLGCLAIAGFPLLSASSRRTRSCGRPTGSAATAARCGDRVRHGRHDGLLHVPPVPHDVQPLVPRHAGAAEPRSRVAPLDDRAAHGPGRGRGAAGYVGVPAVLGSAAGSPTSSSTSSSRSSRTPSTRCRARCSARGARPRASSWA
jgi:hypothetical protein